MLSLGAVAAGKAATGTRSAPARAPDTAGRRRAWLVAALAWLPLLAMPLLHDSAVQGPLDLLKPYALLLQTLTVAASVLLCLLGSWLIWQTAFVKRQPGLIWLACCLQGAAVLLAAHTLSLPGMPDFVTPAGTGKAWATWLGARAFIAAGLLGVLFAPWCPVGGPVHRRQALRLALLVLAGALVLLSLQPAAGQAGLVAAGVVLAALFALAAWRAARTPGRGGSWFLAAAASALPSELLMAWDSASHGHLPLLAAAGMLLSLYLLHRGVLHLLREALNRLGELAEAFEATTVPVLLCDAGGRIRRVNDALCEVSGHGRAELLGRRLEEFECADEPAATYAELHLALREGRPWRGRVPMARRDGSRYLQQRSLTPIHGALGERSGFVCIGEDETERGRAEQLLRNSEESLRQLVDCAPDAIIVSDEHGRILRCNAQVLPLLGYTPEELEGRPLRVLVPREAHGRLDAQMARVQQGRAPLVHSGREVRGVRKDGSIVDVHLRVGEMPYRGGRCLVGFVRDITLSKRAEAERERLQRQLMQAQKMEALGQLTGGLAHDFNNMLAGILGLSTLALQRHVDDPGGKLATYLHEIVKVSERGRDLIDKLMAFARPRDNEPLRQTALEPVLREVLRMLRSALPSRIELQFEAAPDLPLARFAPVDLHQVVTNLVINARDAIAGEGLVLMRLDSVTLAPASGTCCASCAEAVAGHWLRLRVQDSGCGIDAEVQRRMFEPFFTTKGSGKGTGLGMAMVHSLVHKAGGHLLVRGCPGAGTTIEMLLPAGDEAAAGPALLPAQPLAAAAAAPATASGRSVWVVDDDLTVRHWLAELLAGHGLAVRTFADPREALQALQQQQQPPDLLVTDQTMPQLSGAELARAALQRWPGLRVVLCTGHSDSIDEVGAKAIGIARFLRKPFDPQQLLDLASEAGACRDAGAEPPCD